MAATTAPWEEQRLPISFQNSSSKLFQYRETDPAVPDKTQPHTTMSDQPTAVSQTKQFRKDLDAVLQNLKLSSIPNGPHPCRASKADRGKREYCRPCEDRLQEEL